MGESIDCLGHQTTSGRTHYGSYAVIAKMPEDATEAAKGEISLERAEEAILRYLVEYQNQVENIRLLAITVRENECNSRDIQPAEIPLPEIHERIVSTYLPKLASDGYILYDRTNETVTLNAPADKLPQLRE